MVSTPHHATNQAQFDSLSLTKAAAQLRIMGYQCKIYVLKEETCIEKILSVIVLGVASSPLPSLVRL